MELNKTTITLLAVTLAILAILFSKLAEAVAVGASVNNHRFYKVRESENGSIAKYYDEDANVVCYTRGAYSLTCVKL